MNNNIVNQNQQHKNIMPKMQMAPRPKKVVQNQNAAVINNIPQQNQLNYIQNQNAVMNNNIQQGNQIINNNIQNQKPVFNNNIQQKNPLIQNNIQPQNQNQLLVQNNQINNIIPNNQINQNKIINQQPQIRQNLNQVQPQNVQNTQKSVNIKNPHKPTKDLKKLSTIKEEESYIKQSGFVKKENQLELEENNQNKETENPIEQKVPEKTETKDIEANNNLQENQQPMIQSTRTDLDDKFDKLPTINSIMQGKAELLPPSKKKKY